MGCLLVRTVLVAQLALASGAGSKPLFDYADHYVMLILYSIRYPAEEIDKRHLELLFKKSDLPGKWHEKIEKIVFHVTLCHIMSQLPRQILLSLQE